MHEEKQYLSVIWFKKHSRHRDFIWNAYKFSFGQHIGVPLVFVFIHKLKFVKYRADSIHHRGKLQSKYITVEKRTSVIPLSESAFWASTWEMIAQLAR